VSSESLLEAKSYTDGSWHRLHPLTPVLRAGLAVLAVIGVVFAIVWETFLDSLAHYLIFREFPENPQSNLPDIPFVDSLGGAAALAIGALVGGALWLWLSWFVHRVRISDSLIEVVDGVVFRTHRQARRDRVNSVALWRPLIPRLFGLSKLEFQSAGSDANATLSYLPHPIALELRRIVMQNIEKEQSGAEEATEPPATLHVEVPLERLLGSLLVSVETAWLVAVFGAIVASWLISGDPVVWVAAFPAAVFYVLTVARQWSRASQFRLESTPHTVRVSYGLLSTTSASIPPDKVHALHIATC
jgi:Predicted membrane protein